MISFRKFVWKLLHLLPDDVRYSIIRAQIDLKKELLIDFKFKIATTQEEIEQGFKLLYECYLENGLMNPNNSELRITKYHLLPTSTIIVGKRGNEVVATVTHVMDSPFGLPCENHGNMAELRKQPNPIAEISALAIKKGYRRNNSILFALTRYLYTYSTIHCGVRYWVICINSRVEDYYRAIFFFTPLGGEVFKYDFVNGKSSVTLKADLNGLVGLFENHYKALAPHQNLYDFYLNDDREAFEEWPDFVFKTSTLPVFNPEMIKYFFDQKVDILNGLTAIERREVLNAYHDPIYEAILENHEARKPNRRKDPRRVVNMRGFLIFNNGLINQLINVSILNVSRGGMLVFCEHDLPEDQELEFQIEIIKDQTILVKSAVIAKITEVKFACRVEAEGNPAWIRFIESIESHISEFNSRTQGVLRDEN